MSEHEATVKALFIIVGAVFGLGWGGLFAWFKHPGLLALSVGDFGVFVLGLIL